MRIFSASMATETNTFAPCPTSLNSFKSRNYFPAGKHPDEPTHFGGLVLITEQALKLGQTVASLPLAFFFRHKTEEIFHGAVCN